MTKIKKSQFYYFVNECIFFLNMQSTRPMLLIISLFINLVYESLQSGGFFYQSSNQIEIFKNVSRYVYVYICVCVYVCVCVCGNIYIT